MLSRRRTRPAPRPDAADPWPFVGMVGMATTFFLYAASAPFTPWWVQTLMLVWWAFCLLVASAWFTLHPRWVPWVAVVSALSWFAVVVPGGIWLGWE